jgi:hypothetical protein
LGCGGAAAAETGGVVAVRPERLAEVKPA